MAELDEDDLRYESIMAGLKLHAQMGPPKPKRWVAEGFLAFSELSAFFGEPGATKSVLLTDIACRVAAGINWDGEETGSRRSVVYIAAERPAQVRRRADAFCTEHGIDRLGNLVIYDGPIDLSEYTGLSAVIGESCAVLGGAPSLVIVDTLAMAMSKPDSSTDATAAAAESLTYCARAFDAHIAIVHHQPLSGEKRLRGGHLTAAMDMTVHVSQRRDRSVAQVMKDNDAPDGDRMRLTYSLKSVEVACADGSTVSAPVVVPCGAGGEPEADRPVRLSKHRQAALDALVQASADGPVSDATWRERHDAAEPDTSKTTLKKRFERSREWLAEHGLAVKEGELWSLGEGHSGRHSGTGTPGDRDSDIS